MNDMTQGSSSFSREEPIPGYHTTELLGRGGFGEVWQAVAPGGVSKAIKLVFGDDSTRADSELRSLNRIKDVRHPLILSIDRIEVVKGTLVIVTELGDCNLKEYYQQFRARGQLGIPQADLLKMLHNAAEALDFIYAEHSLQHLDVKPENFLVFGKHLKVADFGLVKHIYERSASMLHGLTPIYSAPELFEGKANRYSDQYSLAIVYQQMLTGKLPFDGLSAARLATQHLMEPPNLEGLPAQQQPVIARALSKDPHQRFASCVELIEQLEEMSAKKADNTPPKEIVRESATPASRHSSRADTSTTKNDAQRETKVPNTHQVVQEQSDAVLAQIERDSQTLSPTVVIGVGGTAANVLQNLRRRINNRLGRLREAPAIRFVLIDSEIRQLNEVNRDKDVWQEIHTVATPLRKSEEYQSQYPSLKRWINRRWLFNIPRDQSTDSIRPLGRLALFSNFQRVSSELDKSFAECCSEEAATRSSQELDIPFDAGKPRVIIVTSIAGGTGGGMLFDLAYAIRGKLKKAGYQNNEIEAVLLHSTPNNKGRDQAIANAYATLQELEHYSQRGNYYPGDSKLGIDAFHGNNRTFRTVEFVQLGDHLSEQQWNDATDDVAEHLYTSLLNPQFLRSVKCDDSRIDSRWVSVRQLGASNRTFLNEFSSQMCVDLFESWRGCEIKNRTTVSLQPTTLMKHSSVENSSKHRRLCESLDTRMEELGLSADRLMDLAQKMIAQEVGQELDEYTKKLIHESLEFALQEGGDNAAAPLVMIDHCLSVDEPIDENSVTLFSTVMPRAETQAQKCAGDLRKWLQGLVDDEQARVDGAQFTAETARIRIQDIIGSITRERLLVQESMAAIRRTLTEDHEELDRRRSSWIPFRSGRPSKRQSLLNDYATAGIKWLVLAVVFKQFRAIEAQVGSAIDQMQRLSHDLSKISGKFKSYGQSASTDSSANEQDDSIAWYVQSVRDAMIEKRAEILQELEEAAESSLSEAGHTLQHFLDPRLQLNDFLQVALQDHSRDVVSRTVAKVHCELIDGQPDSEGQADADALLPRLINNVIRQESEKWDRKCERHAVIIPESANASGLETHLRADGNPIDVASFKTNGITLVQYINNTSLYELATSLSGGIDIYRELADRLHSRDDVDWTPLTAWEELPTHQTDQKNDDDVVVDYTVALNS